MASARHRGSAPPQAPSPHRNRALLLLAALACLAGHAAAQQPAAPGDWTVVTDMRARLEGVEVSIVGAPQQAFARAAPRTLDPHLLSDFAAQLGVLQEVSGEGNNMFTDTAEQYVATVHGGYVEGEGGLVYDGAGRVFRPPHFFFTRTSPLQPMPQHTLAQAAATCERHPVLASVVQRYGHMYYHFVMETLPRVALLAQSGRLTADVKLLTWGHPYEYEFLEALGVSRGQVVPYNASRIYCTDHLLVPTPTPRITPPREGLLAVQRGLGGERDLIVYVSRQGEASRRVGNEDELLAAVRAAFPQHQVAVFGGSAPKLTLQQTIELFQQARVVLGPHGAGLSHILFAAPGTTVLEFHFLADPPLMFWHAAAALGQPYWLLPVPQAYWMQPEMQVARDVGVPVQEVLDVLGAVLPRAADPARPAICQPGTYAGRSADGTLTCTACSAGTYAFGAGAAACKPCTPGRATAALGSSACRTCQPGTYSGPGGKQCLPCPAGTFSALAGAWDAAQCLTPEQRRSQQEDTALSVQLLSKLSPVFEEQRRRLIETTGAASLSRAELCAAQKLAGSFNGPYGGPYLAGVPTAAALLANCSDAGLGQVAAPPAYPGVVPLIVVVAPAPAPITAPATIELPPLVVPLLPPALLPQPPAAPPQVTAVLPKKKKVVDDYVIILACVLGSLLVLPLLALLARRVWRARQHAKARASAKRPLAAAASGAYARQLAFSNPTFQPVAVDEDADSSSARH